MSRYFTPSLFTFSTVGGIVTAVIVSFVTDDTPTIALFSAIATLLISVSVPTLFALADRKFIPLRKEIKEKIVIDERVNYIVGDEIRHGFIITTKDSLYILSSENEKPIKFEFKRNDIRKVSVTEGVYLNIFLDYDKCIRVFAGNCEEISSKLRAEGFGA